MAKNKLQKFAEMEEYDHVFQADFSDIYDDNTDAPRDASVLERLHFAMRGQWNEKFFGNANPIVVELGCGKGEYTVGLARLFPDKNFIGVDIKGARMHTGAAQAKAEGLKNVAFIRTRIEFIEAFFDKDEVSEIWITFPDPQMRKERKRLVGTLMLTRYRKFLKPEGFVHLKTDSPFLYCYTSEMLRVNGIEAEVALDDLYGSVNVSNVNTPLAGSTESNAAAMDAITNAASAAWAEKIDPRILSIQTYYESKWLEHGLTIKYFRFNIPAEKILLEPDIDIEHDTYHMVGRGVQEKKNNNKKK